MVEARSAPGAELSTTAKLLNAHCHAPHLPYRLEEEEEEDTVEAREVMNVSTQRVRPFAFRMQIEFNHTQEQFPHVVLQPKCGQQQQLLMLLLLLLLSLSLALMHYCSSIIIELEIENEYQF